MPIIRRILKVLALLGLLWFVGYLYIRSGAEPWKCPRTEQIFLGQKYSIEECRGGYNNENPHYSFRMRIYSLSGELLGQRDFTVWTAPMSETMEYLNDKIIYTNAIRDDDHGVPEIETKTLQFPLTRRDWFEANLDRILFSP